MVSTQMGDQGLDMVAEAVKQVLQNPRSGETGPPLNASGAKIILAYRDYRKKKMNPAYDNRTKL